VNEFVEQMFDPDGPLLEEQVPTAALAEKARREKIRRDFIAFCHRFYPVAGFGKFKAGWVHHDIAARLIRFMRAVENGERPRLMLLMPPRHGKSTLVSVMFYCWVFGHHPEWKMFNVGYNEDLPLEFSKAIRRVVESKAYREIFPDTIIMRDDRKSDHWKLTLGGAMRAAGLKGGITGHGANIMGVDDPLKGDEEADSENTRDKLWKGYRSNIRTRLHPGGGILLIQTWWHNDDLAGRIMQMNELEDKYSEFRDKFEIVRYPAVTDPGEWEYRDEETLEIIRFTEEKEAPYSPEELEDLNYVLLRGPNEALHEERYSWRELMAIKADVDEDVWNALYQQNPIPETGIFFTREMLYYYVHPPKEAYCNICTGWDFAIGEEKHNNHTAGVTLQHHWGGKMFVRKVRRFKGDSTRIADEMVEEAIYYLRRPDPPYYTIAVEDGQIWKTARPYVKAAFEENDIPWSIVQEYTATTDKRARATPMQDRMKRGLLVIRQSMQWTADFVRELLRFPKTKDKDQVDASAWAVRHLLEIGKPSPPPEEEYQVRDAWANPDDLPWREKLELQKRRGTTHMSA